MLHTKRNFLSSKNIHCKLPIPKAKATAKGFVIPHIKVVLYATGRNIYFKLFITTLNFIANS